VPNNHLTRRDFLQKSAAAAALGATTGCFASARDAQANAAPVQRFRIGQVGCGGMGSIDAGSHGIGGNVVALCDVDIKQAERLNARDARISRHNPLICSDYRRILERDDIDVVSIGTTDHWHVKIAVEALMAGKHVFCQKPLSLTVEENQLIRNAANKYSDQVLFIGTQQRSDPGKFLRAVNMVQKDRDDCHKPR